VAEEVPVLVGSYKFWICVLPGSRGRYLSSGSVLRCYTVL